MGHSILQAARSDSAQALRARPASLLALLASLSAVALVTVLATVSAAVLATVLVTVSAAPASAQVATDGSLPGVPAQDLTGPDYEIPSELGHRSGETLFHSFETFSITEGGSAEFTPGASTDPAPTYLISRVTGGAPSEIAGRVSSTVGESHFLFINPSGVAFTEGSSISVPGGFHVSTAQQVEFANGDVYSAIDLGGSTLSTSHPVAFGFLGGDVPAPISVAGILEVQDAEVGPGQISFDTGDTLSLVGGELTVDGGVVSSVGGDVLLVAVGSDGRVTGITGPSDDVALEGFTARADIHLLNNAVISASGISPVIQPLPGLLSPKESLTVPYLRGDGSRGNIAQAFWVVTPESGDSVVFQSPSTGLYRVLRAVPHGGEPLGGVRVLGRHLDIVDADVRTLATGDGDSAGIEIDLTGDLSIERVSRTTDVGLLSRSGFTFTGDYPFDPGDGLIVFEDIDVIFAGTGAAGDIDVTARNVRMSNGATASATSFTEGRSGDVTFLAPLGSIELDGRSPDGTKTSLFSNAEGIGDGGDITIEAGELRLLGGAALTATSTGDAAAGDITIRVGTLELLNDSEIDNTASAGLLTSDAPATRTGTGGQITIEASERVRLSGRESGELDFARVSTWAGRGTTGDAGDIRITTPLLQVDDGAAISTTTNGAGAAGDVILDVGRLELTRAAEISSESLATAAALPGPGGPIQPGAAGSIEIGLEGGPGGGTIALGDVSISGGSQITTFAAEGPQAPADPSQADALREGHIRLRANGQVTLAQGSRIVASVGEGLGGSIDLEATEALILRDDAVILAEAESTTVTGQGGRIDIVSNALFVSPNATISAAAGLGIDGEVNLRAPEAQVEGDLQPVEAQYLDASSLLRPACAARAAGEGGSFTVSRMGGLPVSAEETLLALLPTTPGAAYGSPSVAASNMTIAMRDADAALRRGDAEAAAHGFETAAVEAERSGDGVTATRALRGLGDAHQLVGRYAAAAATLQQAVRQSSESGDTVEEAAALGSLANAMVALGRGDEAIAAFEDALELVRSLDRPDLAAVLANNLGNHWSTLGDHAQALDAYSRAAELARNADTRGTESLALSNAARAALRAGTHEQASEWVADAAGLGSRLPPSLERWSVDVHVAGTHAALALEDPHRRTAHLLAAHAALLEAVELAHSLGDARARAVAERDLGALYQTDGRIDEALVLTRRARASADAARAWDLQAALHAQEAELLWIQDRHDAALAAWRRALALLEATKQEVLVQYGGPSERFRSQLAPVYLAFADALLQMADAETDVNAEQAWLRETRRVLEGLRGAELRDYYRDACVTELEARTTELDALASSEGSRVALVYPVQLSDRLELLVTLPSGLERFTVDVPRARLEAESRHFRRSVADRVTNSYRRHAQQLHAWLVAPYEGALERERVDTLVFAPDGVLRGIPMAALHDGETFVAERFAVAVAPGLSLVDPAPLALAPGKVLLAGISEAVAGMPALPGVPIEIEGLRDAIGGGDVLIDADFTAERFEQRLARDLPSVVHIASHAQIADDPAESFILAHDQAVSLDAISSWVGRARYSEQPVELLVLSGCDTARGSDRAALGLAGVAVRAGARSAVGSLWKVDDRATSALMVDFYTALAEDGTSRAQALRRAQRAALDDPSRNHPYYWSAFLLLSSWL